ncbi:MAG TPA: hypothetical protein VGT61_13245 [Thermomicrobiales bacterium]|nr:hypothetical protein [Thermomicrobiales bacterium]
MWWAAGVVGLVVVLILVGCNIRDGDDNAGPTATVASGQTAEAGAEPTLAPTMAAVVAGTPGAGPVSLGPMTFGEVAWATEVDEATQAPSDALDEIPSDASAIYATVPVSGLTAGTVITVRWSFEGIAIDRLTTEVIAPADIAETWVAFRLDQVDTGTPVPRSETGWPDGEYGVVISADGEVVQQAVIVVGDPITS